MKRFQQGLLLLAVTYLSGCASIFIPKNQKVTITTSHNNSTVYVDNESVGEGQTITTKMAKDGAKQVVVQTPGFKDANYVLLPGKRHPAFWPMLALDIPAAPFTFFLPIIWDMAGHDKFFRYPVSNTMGSTYKYVNKTPNEKYINLEAIKLKIDNREKDLRDIYNVSHSTDLTAKMDQAEKAQMAQELRQEAKNQNKKSKKKKLNEESKSLEFDDTKFSETINKTLKKTGYIDTVNKIFHDNNNTMNLEGVITKASLFHITGVNSSTYRKAKLFITWNIKNSYGEKVDSISGWTYSSDFVTVSEPMFADAVDNSYLALLKNKRFTKHLVLDTNYSIADAPLVLPAASSVVTEVSDAGAATVTIKRKDGGHGSGFAITNDGYILTNFHVIAGNNTAQQAEMTVLLSTGEEIPVKVVRFNRMRDIALLKVDKSFDKVFRLIANKTFKNLMEVYTIGTPKSLELGQSVSLGLISNERKTNTTNLLQLSMTVNAGNSGGPLFEKNGTLQGVVTSKLVGFATEGVGFAIPSYMIASYLNLTVN